MDIPVTVEKEPKNVSKIIVLALVAILVMLGFGFWQLTQDVKSEMREAKQKYMGLQGYVAGRLFLAYKDDNGINQIAPLGGGAVVKQEFELSKEEKEMICK